MEIINIKDKLENEIPELKELNCNQNLIYIDKLRYDKRIKYYEDKNLAKYHKTLYLSSYFDYCICEITDNKILTINKIAYKLIAEYVTSYKFNSRIN